MENIEIYLQTLPLFAAYFALSVVIFSIYLAVYLKVTPYDEFALIKQGNGAAAASLSGSVLGFVLPLSSVVASSLNLVDMALWATVALLVQILVFLLLRLLMPSLLSGIPNNNIAQGLVLGVMSLAAGIINAACMLF